MDHLLHARQGEALVNGLMITSLHFDGEEQRQERNVVELLGACAREPFGQGGSHSTELQVFGQATQMGIEGPPGTCDESRWDRVR
ncbi:MAG: hypothetical protein ACKVVP_08495 [Chloroflexota bacterium]